MPATMLAEQFHADTREVRLERVPVPDPGPYEVRIKVAFCGICHSDLSLIDGSFHAPVPVVTQGHEVSGWIDALGPEVEGWAVGDAVIPSAGRPCLACATCRSGNPASCPNLRIMAFHFDGGWAEYLLAPAGGLTRVPDGMPMEQAAILADAVSTPYGAVTRTARVQLGEAVGVWGVGGLGTHLVQLSRLAGAHPVIAVDTNPAVVERAVRLGADFSFDVNDPQLRARIAEVTGGQMLDVAFDCAGVQQATTQALAMTAPHGRTVVVGISGQEVAVGGHVPFTLQGKQLLGHLGYKVPDIAKLTQLVSAGRLDLSQSISTVLPLSEIERGIEMLQTHEGNPVRILVQP